MKRQKCSHINTPALHFRIWKRAGYAIMASLGKVVNISRLKVSMCASEEEKDGRTDAEQTFSEVKEHSEKEKTKISIQDILEQALSLFTEKKITTAHAAGKKYIYI